MLRNSATAPYLRLLSAVVMSAVYEHIANLRRYGDDVAGTMSAARWLMSCEYHGFSLAWCCEMLNVSPDRIRVNMNDIGLVKNARESVKVAAAAAMANREA